MQRAEKEDEARTLWQSLIDISAKVLHELQQVIFASVLF